MKIDVSLDETPEFFDVRFSGCQEIDIEFGQIQQIASGDIPVYEGDYTVTPNVDGKTLQTKDKLMKENVIVEKIPCFVVSNISGGNTVYIAKEM